MGEYYGVKAVLKKGRLMGRMTDRPPFVLSSEVLVGIADNGVNTIAADLTDKTEYDHFYGTYAKGHYLRIDLYVLPRSEIPNCPDEGQVPSSEIMKH